MTVYVENPESEKKTTRPKKLKKNWRTKISMWNHFYEFLYTNNNLSEREILKDEILLTIAFKQYTRAVNRILQNINERTQREHELLK